MFAMLFPVSGVEIHPLVPAAVAFGVSFFTSMGGVSGAFLLLPFQVSVLGYTAPSVSATNHVFNVVAIPSGVYRYIREGRMLWPLTGAVVVGTLPGVFIGAWIRVAYLPDPKNFKFFVGLVLLYIGGRLLMDMLRRARPGASGQPAGPPEGGDALKVLSASFRRVRFRFGRQTYTYAPLLDYGI